MSDEMKPCARCKSESRRAAQSTDGLCVQCAGTEDVRSTIYNSTDKRVLEKHSTALSMTELEETQSSARRILESNEPHFPESCKFEERPPLHPVFQLVLEGLKLHENFALNGDYFWMFGFFQDEPEQFCLEHGLSMTRSYSSFDIVFSRPRNWHGLRVQLPENFFFL